MKPDEIINMIEAHRNGRGINADEMAKRFDMSRQQYWRVVSGKSPLTMDFAFIALKECGYTWMIAKDVSEFKGIIK